jgi:hypothetical protein
MSFDCLFTFAIFSSFCDIKLTFEVKYFSGRSRNFENGCKTIAMTIKTIILIIKAIVITIKTIVMTIKTIVMPIKTKVMIIKTKVTPCSEPNLNNSAQRSIFPARLRAI